MVVETFVDEKTIDNNNSDITIITEKMVWFFFMCAA